MRSLLRPALAAALLLLAVPVQGAAGSSGEELIACRSLTDGKSPITMRADRWVRIGPPKFDAGEGPAKVTAFTAAPYANGVFVTNGKAVKLSADAGCTWNSIYPANGLASPSEEAFTADVFTHLVAPTPSSLWAASYDDIGGLPHPHVYVGSNVGTGKGSPSFQRIDVGMPTYGRPVELLASPLPSQEAYLLLDELPETSSGAALRPSRRLYTTARPDAAPQAGALTGVTWREVVAPSGFGRIEGVTRQGGRSVWIWGGTKVAYGTAVNGPDIAWQTANAPGTVLRVEVDSAGRALVFSKGPQGIAIDVADKNGKLKPYGGVPVEPLAVAHGQLPDTLVISGTKGTWGFDNRLQRWVDITPSEVAPFRHLEMAQGTAARVVLGLNDDALYRWDTYRGETFIEPPPPPRGVGDPNNPTVPVSNLRSALLTPRSQTITVQPGEVRDVPVRFRVPPAPQPLDVYFLMDTTASMSSAIEGLQRSVNKIARDIRSKLGVTACFGVGDVKDVGSATPYIFKTHLPVSPCDTSAGLVKVHEAVAKLAQSAGGDAPEAQTIALSQAATGLGQAYLPVTPGEGARFRAEAFKVIVLISDAGAHEGEGYPTVEEAAKTLNVQDIKVVSLAVNNSNGTLGDAHAMMTRLANLTDSLAPPAGVDCDNDGEMHYGDRGPGEPLICEVSGRGTSGANVGPAIIGLLFAVKDPGTIAVDVRDDYGVVLRPVRGLTSAIKDLKRENGLGFTLSLRCTDDQDGRDLPVDLTPTVRSRSVGLQGQLLVRCRSKPLPLAVVPPKVVEPDPSPPRPPVTIAAPVVPAPVNPPAQPISNINPNAGFSHQEEQQMQLATVTEDATEEQDEVTELAMSALPEPRAHRVDVWLAAAALTASSAYALGLRRRTQLRSQVRRAHI